MNEDITKENTEAPIKKKLELDIDVTPRNEADNPFAKWVHLAKTVDAWRIFPRIFVSVYIILLYNIYDLLFNFICVCLSRISYIKSQIYFPRNNIIYTSPCINIRDLERGRRKKFITIIKFYFEDI